MDLECWHTILMRRSCSRSHLCSWEIPYDFTPRIHAYPGVDHGVVRRAWEGPAGSAAPTCAQCPAIPSPAAVQKEEEEENTASQPPPPPCSRRGRRVRWSAPAAKPRAVNLPPHRGRHAAAPRTSRSRRAPPALSATADAPPTSSLHQEESSTATAEHEHVPHPPPAEGTPVTVVQRPHRPAPPPPRACPSAGFAPRRRLQQRQQPEGTAPPRLYRPQRAGQAAQQQRYTADDVARLLCRSVPSQTAPSPSGGAAEASEAMAPVAARHRYAPRTDPLYTLPPQYGQWRRWLRQNPTVPVHFADSYSSRHAPPAAFTVTLPHKHSQRLTSHTVRILQEAWATAGLPPPPAAQHSVAGAGDYNGNVLDAYARTHAARLAAVEALEEAVYDRLIGGVVPIEEVLTQSPDAAAEGLPTAAKVECLAVLDGGHLDEPIVLAGTTPMPASSPLPVEAGGVAVLVRPIEAELRQAASNVDSGVERVHAPHKPALLPRGREWDRQRAIQNAVGPTAQEAIIDLQLDPRYRHPGEYVRWRRHRGQQRAVK